MGQLMDILDHTIDELGINPPKYVISSDTVGKAISTMQENKIGSALVIDEGIKLQGIFTERDILMKVANKNINLDDPVSKFMTPSPQTIAGNESVVVALSIMAKEDFRHLPVVNMDGSPVGIVSLRDIMKYFANHLKDD